MSNTDYQMPKTFIKAIEKSRTIEKPIVNEENSQENQEPALPLANIDKKEASDNLRMSYN